VYTTVHQVHQIHREVREKTKRNKERLRENMSDLHPLAIKMMLTVLFGRFVNDNGDSGLIGVEELHSLISSCNQRHEKRRLPNMKDVLLLVHALSFDDGKSGKITFEEFEAWVQKGLALNEEESNAFQSKGETEALLVDFLLSIKMDILEIEKNIMTSVTKFASTAPPSSSATTPTSTTHQSLSDTQLDAKSFSSMISSAATDIDGLPVLTLERIDGNEAMIFLLAVISEESVSVHQVLELYCRAIINHGLIMWEGDHNFCNVWALIRRMAYRLVDSVLEQRNNHTIDDHDYAYNYEKKVESEEWLLQNQPVASKNITTQRNKKRRKSAVAAAAAAVVAGKQEKQQQQDGPLLVTIPSPKRKASTLLNKKNATSRKRMKTLPLQKTYSKINSDNIDGNDEIRKLYNGTASACVHLCPPLTVPLPSLLLLQPIDHANEEDHHNINVILNYNFSVEKNVIEEKINCWNDETSSSSSSDNLEQENEIPDEDAMMVDCIMLSAPIPTFEAETVPSTPISSEDSQLPVKSEHSKTTLAEAEAGAAHPKLSQKRARPSSPPPTTSIEPHNLEEPIKKSKVDISSTSITASSSNENLKNRRNQTLQYNNNAGEDDTDNNDIKQIQTTLELKNELAMCKKELLKLKEIFFRSNRPTKNNDDNIDCISTSNDLLTNESS
jgi:hypothetical protein